MTDRPRLLYLGHNLPYPPHEGALIRSYHTVRLLARQFDVTGLYFFRRSAISSPEELDTAVEAMEEFGTVRAFPIPQEWSRGRFAADHLRSLLSSSPYTRWTYDSREFREALDDVLEREAFDLVHVDSLDLLGYLGSLDGLPTVLAHHNVESSLLDRRARSERGLKRRYIEFQARLVERAEREWCARVDLNVAVSRDDAARFEKLAPACEVLVIPNGVDVRAFTPNPVEATGGIVFVGGYSWFPNTDGMEYFATEILPLIRAEEPTVPVKWIGKAPDDAKQRFREMGVEMLGYVDDIRPHMDEARCAIVPLRVGGGTRLKILDAWALGKAVVSTTRGCEGLDIRPGRNILVADEPRSFAEAVIQVLRDPALRRTLETGGRETAVSGYDWDALGEIMVRRYCGLGLK